MAQRGVLEGLFPAAIAECLAGQRAPLVDAIAAGVDAGGFTSDDPAADALAVHHLCLGLLGDQLSGTATLSRDEAVALVERFALGALEAA